MPINELPNGWALPKKYVIMLRLCRILKSHNRFNGDIIKLKGFLNIDWMTDF